MTTAGRVVAREPTGLIVQRDHAVLVDFAHVVDDVLWVDMAPIQHLIQRSDPQNLLEADLKKTFSLLQTCSPCPLLKLLIITNGLACAFSLPIETGQRNVKSDWPLYEQE